MKQRAFYATLFFVILALVSFAFTSVVTGQSSGTPTDELDADSLTATAAYDLASTATALKYPTDVIDPMSETLTAEPTTTFTGPTPTPVPPKINRLPWPLKPVTDVQLQEARNCNAESLANKLNVIGTKTPVPASNAACDWAALAVAYAKLKKEEQPPPDAGIAAFQQAISQNSALAFTLPLLRGYFGTQGMIDAPPFASQPIVRAEIKHTFSGIGDQVAFSFVITNADSTKPVVSGESGVDTKKKITGTIDKKLVQALGSALTDFVPMRNQFSQVVCYDDYPDWTVTLTFKDGTTLKLVTNESNIYFSGGPWQTEIDKQNYMQYSAAFLIALLDIRKALKLPEDETAAMTCGGGGDPFSLAFDTPEATKSK
jgi:hypothetical protein